MNRGEDIQLDTCRGSPPRSSLDRSLVDRSLDPGAPSADPSGVSAGALVRSLNRSSKRASQAELGEGRPPVTRGTTREKAGQIEGTSGGPESGSVKRHSRHTSTEPNRSPMAGGL